MLAALRRSGRRIRNHARLPQVSSPLSIADYRSAGGHTFALVCAEQTSHYTVLLRCESTLTHWAELFSHDAISLGTDSPDVVALTAVCTSAPVSVDGRRQWLLSDGQHHLDSDTDIGVHTHLAITFAALSESTRKDPADMGVEVGARLPTLIGSLLATGLSVSPMITDEVLDLTCQAYNEDLEPDDISWSDIGPQDYHRVRNLFCHDGFESHSWLVSPHVINSGVLEQLLLPSSQSPRKTVTVTYRSIRLSPSLEPDDPSALTFQPRLEAFGAIITATEPVGRTPSIETLREELPLYARLAIRKGYDRQAELFAGAVGIGVLLPEHGEISDEPTRHRHRPPA